MTKILDLNSKEDAKKKIVQLKKEITKLQAIVDKKDSLFDRIKTIDDVYKELKLKKLTYFETYGEFAGKMEAMYHINNIAKLFNEGWKPNWSNSNEYKYFPYFNTSSFGGLVFGASCFRSCDSFCGGGCFL